MLCPTLILLRGVVTNNNKVYDKNRKVFVYEKICEQAPCYGIILQDIFRVA